MIRSNDNSQALTNTSHFRYKDLSDEEKAEVENKIDNFLEAVYIAPNLFDREVIHTLKLREDCLKRWRHNGQALGGTTAFLLYCLVKRRSGTGFYFRNFWYMISFVLFSAYGAGRLSEMVGNKKYYKDVLVKLAVNYNITDSEIEDLHIKINEFVLSENKEQQKKGSLDKVSFKI
jgi:hypothetical protein